MTTSAETKQQNKKRSHGGSDDHKSAFSWGNNETGMMIGAAVAGAAMGFAANMGRKFFVQATSGMSGDWADALMTEHKMTLAIFGKIEATDDSQTMMRSTLLAKLKFALSKHSIEEEMVIYPALRQAGRSDEADELTSDHGYVKTYLYELENMEKDSPQWLARVRDFRKMIEEHIREEENDLFPALRAKLSEQENKKLTMAMNKEGFKFA